ncbi:uncharacterized protein OGAPODRAFT_15310 [Ogataea polymorpha]|uniref:uncharacterized protein n=1 Tax=Ogataea polymorpha TaxID=460523 RepID=UPI0007F54EC3|nr:uncharacterized protein OGAPODRAFT_15310 [Ogataea polymorpha]OBA18622.1 hypothetical protein OGAPODRAFT_15310 [Ogataea polymorpha]
MVILQVKYYKLWGPLGNSTKKRILLQMSNKPPSDGNYLPGRSNLDWCLAKAQNQILELYQKDAILVCLALQKR